jgi:hypothetical protein
MPTILRENGYRLFFYSREGSEPPHIHIIGKGGEAKIWLQPVEISKSYNLGAKEQRDILKIVKANIELLLTKYKEWHGLNS